MAFICDGQFEVPQQEMAAAERKIKLEMVKEIKVETEKKIKINIDMNRMKI